MKYAKVLALALGIAMLCPLCGCEAKGEKSAKPAELDENLTVKAEITQGEFKCGAEFKRGSDTWECTFTSPDNIKGMVVTLSGENCKIDFEKLTYSLDRKNLPDSSMINLVTRSLDSIILQKDVECTQSGDIVTENGKISGVDFTAKLKDGKVTELSVADEISAKFS